ncbi:MAG: glycoside hydrolase family 32 protein, partial [Clostridiales bacterium]|nr:glycoside hydrolase family 32 protein [Clostridiales bacterium]
MLIGLELEHLVTDRSFSPDEAEYWAEAPYDMQEICVLAQAEQGDTVALGEYRMHWQNGAVYEVKTEAQEQAECRMLLTVGQNSFFVRCNEKDYILHVLRPQDPQKLFKEPLRPQFHFSQYQYSLNDPNGLCYDAVTEEYLMFYQSDRPFRWPYQVSGNQKSWALAVSRDLVSWKDCGLVIKPDENGVIWSGSCVIDKENTSGFFDDSVPPESRIVALYTYYGATKPSNGLCSVGVAYSCDHGRSFTKPFSEPVIPNTGNCYCSGMRDPKVIWYTDSSYENGGIWVMAVAGGRAQLFTSQDLIHWQRDRELCNADGSPLDSECPDIFCLYVDEDLHKPVWVYSGCGVFYILGRLFRDTDGKMNFYAESQQIVPVNGVSELYPGTGLYPEMYATQGFYNDRNGRRVEISWMRDLTCAENKPWFNAESLALEVQLKTVNGELRLVKYPVEELECLRGELLADISDMLLLPDGTNPLGTIRETMFDLEAVIRLDSAEEVIFTVRQGEKHRTVIAYDAKEHTLKTDKTDS